MTLEDFVSVTELKDGLTSSSQVKELVNAMLAERDSVSKNDCDVTTIANTIAATEEKEYLDLFVELDGVSFIKKWLEDAEKLDNEPSDSSAEESIAALLLAVEKLYISYEQSLAYGIRVTVEKLLNYNSVRVQEKAKALFGSWNQVGDGDTITGEEKHIKTDDDVANMCSDVVPIAEIDDIETQLDNDEKALHDDNMKDGEESLCTEGENSPCHLGGDASNSTSIALVPKEDGMVSNQSSSDEEEKQEIAIPLKKLASIEISPSSMVKDSEPVAQSDLQNDTVTEVDNNLKESATSDIRMDTSSSSSKNNSIKNVGVLESPEKSTSSGDSDSINDADFFKTIKEDYDVGSKKRSDLGFSYGICDALEVARQVANEVEREVVGQIEESSSDSSQKNLVEPKEPDSPASVHEGEVSKDQNAPLVEEENESKPDKEINDFDLNEGICFDDVDRSLDMLPAPVSIVSAYRATAALGFPESPLQFEGAHGWKGSASTSAFRVASPRKIHDSDKNDYNDLNNRQNFLDFDLNNMSEEGDKIAAEEAKLNLDLNRMSDESDPQPSDWRLCERLLLGRNGHHIASPSTSSSSMQQPSRNFDLNDQPSFFNNSSAVNLKSDSQKLHSFIGPRSDNNVISIMGMKVEVNRKDFPSQPPSLPNGKILEPATDANLPRNGGILGIRSPVPYPHPGMFLYNGPTNGPPPPGPFSPFMYGPGGPIPFMVPQHLGSAPYSQTPFASAGTCTGLYGPGPSRPTFELNLGLMGERINRESGDLRQFLGPGPNQSIDDFRSIGLGKRKEPDGGWEPYPFEYKHQYPQWR